MRVAAGSAPAIFAIRRQPAVHDERLPRDVRGRRAGEIAHRRRYLARVREALERHAAQHPFAEGGIGERGLARGGRHPSRRDRVQPDAVRRPLVGEHARHVHDARLGDAVGKALLQRHDAVGGGDADDQARPAGRDEVARHLLRHEERALEVGVHHQVPLVGGRVQGELLQGGRRVVDEHLDAARIPRRPARAPSRCFPASARRAPPAPRARRRLLCARRRPRASRCAWRTPRRRSRRARARRRSRRLCPARRR